ncbi:ubiquitin-conjugating enzyme E2 11 [Morus notabilis]|uniref:ubiquitin-conjugating enzyme E2 11 n=1 Tax=Morus notabilis TaxID=981085 RepID=UPI000CED6406|nr:ubiquitin-conjugating enzyme E2 11 [Morus notabilis]
MEDTSEALRHWIYKRERIEEADFPACCSYGPISWENPSKWQGVILGPPGSPYEDGVFFLSIDLPDEYPSKPPTIKFKTKVFHPNIDEDGTIYVDILEEDQWNPIQTIETLLLSICSLLADPDPVDPFYFNRSCYLYQNDWEEYNKTAKEWTRKYAMGQFDDDLYKVVTT